MKKAKLTRTCDDGKQTVGNFTCEDFHCGTLELPWLNNTSLISCIPAGKYTVMQTYSPRHGRYMWEIMLVPNRTGIRFDVANFAKQLKGCVALGQGYGDINGDGEIDILHSQPTNNAFDIFFNKETFELEIIAPAL